MGIFGSIGKALNPMNAPGMKKVAGAMGKAPGMQTMARAIPGAVRNVTPGLAGMVKPGIGPSQPPPQMPPPQMAQQPDWSQMQGDPNGGMGGQALPQPTGGFGGYGMAQNLGQMGAAMGQKPQQPMGPSMGGIQGLMAKAKMMQGRR